MISPLFHREREGVGVLTSVGFSESPDFDSLPLWEREQKAKTYPWKGRSKPGFFP
jgi:hypothetical protein